jgi:phenylacetate-CoA ligase
MVELIKSAHKWVPCYTYRFKEIGLLPDDIKTLEDVNLIPPLSRQELIENYKDLIDIRFQSSINTADRSKRNLGAPIPFARFRKHKLIKNTSSGSTGSPVVFYEDGSRAGLNWAYELLVKHWYGFMPGVKEARFLHLSTDYLPNNRVLQMRRHLWNQQILPGMNLQEKDYKLSYQKVIQFRPKILWGITSALVGFADYIRRNSNVLHFYYPRLIITWAAPLYEHEKKLLKRVFNCPVTNIYGAREVGHIAALCHNDSFHIFQENFFVEVENKLNDLGNGLGEIIVTSLDISPMPFIRYRMGDIGELSQSHCACGRHSQILKNVLGRTGEIFITKCGRMIDPSFWCRIFRSEEFFRRIRRFQIVYTKNKDIRIKIARDIRYNAETENFLKKKIASNFSTDTRLILEYVPQIEALVSGKYQMIINEAAR